MASLPRAIRDVVDSFERLPGIGPKSATRLAFYLLNTSESFCRELADSINNFKENIKICGECFSVAENELCEICMDKKRNKRQICVVEKAIDMIAIEKIGLYKGVYHVLGGVINPLEHIGPEDLRIFELLERIQKLNHKSQITNHKQILEEIEIILAISLTMEGEATALYIKNKLKGNTIKITRIGAGLPVGADLEYADEATLSRAMNGRKNM